MALVTDSMSIKADPETILGLLLDVATYPSWMNGYEKVEVKESDEQGRPVLVKSYVAAMGQRASHTVRYEYPAPGRYVYHLFESEVMTKYDFDCTITTDGDASEVTVSQELGLKWPMPQMVLTKMARKGVQGMLAALKERAEA